MSEGPTQWTLAELLKQAEWCLTRGLNEQQDHRIRDFPDERTVRYYTSLGLIDKPRVFRGRVALYDRGQLLQLIAIKSLQLEGYRLGEIQKRLLGASEIELQSICKDYLDPIELQSTTTVSATKPSSVKPFWKTTPKPLDELHDKITTSLTVTVSKNLSLLLGKSIRTLSSEQLAAIHNAALPLIRLIDQIADSHTNPNHHEPNDE